LTIFSDIKSQITQMRLAQRGTLDFSAIRDEAKLDSSNRLYEEAAGEELPAQADTLREIISGVQKLVSGNLAHA
jgi:hypothetical protein